MISLPDPKRSTTTFGIVKAVNKSGELFGLIFDLIQIESDSNLIEVDRGCKVSRSNDILDLVFQFFGDIDTQFAQESAKDIQDLCLNCRYSLHR